MSMNRDGCGESLREGWFVKTTPWLWPVYRPRNHYDSAEAASESIAAPPRTSLPLSVALWGTS